MCAGLHLLYRSNIFQKMCPLLDTRLNLYVAFQAKNKKRLISQFPLSTEMQ